jgi:hypothetical protein
MTVGIGAALLYAIVMYSVGLKSINQYGAVIKDRSFLPVTANFTILNAWNASTVHGDVRAGIASVLEFFMVDGTGASAAAQPPLAETESLGLATRPPPFDPDEYRRRPGRDPGRWGEATTTPHVVFYNIYVQPNITQGKGSNVGDGGVFVPGMQDIKDLLEEQIHQILVSPLGNATLYFNLFGETFDNPTFWCPEGMDCRVLRHMPVGGEKDTLQDLYDFCVDNPSKRVTYVHSKGSFNHNAGNRRTRRLVTKSVVSDACASGMPLSVRYPCNVCAAKFMFSPHAHANGNMWTTECSYIRKLIPPTEFDTRRRNMYRYLHSGGGRSDFPCMAKRTLIDMFDVDGNFNASAMFCQPFALCRYAMETWVFSHPHVIPCNAMKGLLSDYRDGLEEWTPALERVHVARLRMFGIQKDPFFLKQGRWWEMDYHYGMTPSETNPFFRNYDRIWASEVPCPDASGPEANATTNRNATRF